MQLISLSGIVRCACVFLRVTRLFEIACRKYALYATWNNRQMNDGERTIAGIQAAEGKRLMYRDPMAEREYIKTREQKEEGGEQLEPF